MKKELGLWIDHREAIIITMTAEGEETKSIKSEMEQHVRFPVVQARGNNMASRCQKIARIGGFRIIINAYYDAVIDCIRDADSILIFGPGEAKGELKKRLERDHLDEKIVGLETFDKMTDKQVAAEVRHHFVK